jgi:diguanylate cyclase (GGDEF)-like protein
MRIPIYGSVLFIAMCILLTNPFTGWIFKIDDKNIYTRGGGYWLVFLYAMVVLVGIIAEVIIYRRRYKESHDNKLYFTLLLVPISVTLARLVQYLIYGAALTWPIFTLAILYTYMNMQASENYFDYLTGLRNRRELEFFINYRIKNYKKSNTLFLLYLDLNDFKSINDKYGHPVGDAALVDAANLLRQACQGTEDFIARLGGDEFGIVGVRSSEQDVEELIKRIDTLSEEFNRTSNVVYHISFSCGVSIHSQGITHDELLRVADQSMYQRKNEYYTKNQVK